MKSIAISFILPFTIGVAVIAGAEKALPEDVEPDDPAAHLAGLTCAPVIICESRR